MPTSPLQNVLCRYHYDPLDRSITWAPDRQAHLQRFYCQNRLTTEIQNAEKRSVFQHDDQVLAQHNHLGGKIDATLLATDQQRSVLNALNTLLPHNIAYLPYGHRPLEHSLLSLLGFNGEPPDRVSGHYHLGNGHRQFNPVLMRFNSPDKLSPFGKGGVNAYAYCKNDPLNWSDPSGKMRFRFWKKSISHEKRSAIAVNIIHAHQDFHFHPSTKADHVKTGDLVIISKFDQSDRRKIARAAYNEYKSNMTAYTKTIEKIKELPLISKNLEYTRADHVSDFDNINKKFINLPNEYTKTRSPTKKIEWLYNSSVEVRRKQAQAEIFLKENVTDIRKIQ